MFELASLELAGGLYANDGNLSALGYGALDTRIAKVREGVSSSTGIALLALNGQTAGTVQADMNCAGSASVTAALQAVGSSVTACNSQAITNLSLQAYGATIAQSYSVSTIAYMAGAYATTKQQASGLSVSAAVGQSVFQSKGTMTGAATLSGNVQAVNLTKVSCYGASGTSLLFSAYGDQRLAADGLSALNLTGVLVRDGQHAIAGDAMTDWRIGVYATTAILDAVGAFEVADFELCMGELGGESIRYGSAHAEMICVGQSIAKTDMRASAWAEIHLLPAYALQASYSISGGSAMDGRFSAYGDMQMHINGVSVALHEAPNARLFSWLHNAYDISVRAYEIRKTLRPFESRGVKRPWERRDVSQRDQLRSISWS